MALLYEGDQFNYRGRAYPLFVSLADTQSITVNPYQSATFKITQIIVKDVARGITFTWTNGIWDNQPTITPGTNNLYIQFSVTNTGAVAGNPITAIKETSTGNILQSATTASVAPGAVSGAIGAIGVTMPTTAYGITITVTP